MNPPQAVTERYVSNLIMNGRNKDYDIITVQQQSSKHEGVTVGYFYRVSLHSVQADLVGYGPTITAATRDALMRYGVTFR